MKGLLATAILGCSIVIASVVAGGRFHPPMPIAGGFVLVDRLFGGSYVCSTSVPSCRQLTEFYSVGRDGKIRVE